MNLATELHPMIRKVLEGRPPETVVDDLFAMQDYRDDGFSQQVLRLLQGKTVAVTNLHRQAQGSHSRFKLSCLARGNPYSLVATFKDGVRETTKLKCDATGYRCDLPMTGWEMPLLRTLLGNACMKGPDALRYISLLAPDTHVLTDMLGLPWVEYTPLGVLYRERATVPIRDLVLSTKWLHAGDLFEAVCGRRDGVAVLPPQVQRVSPRDNYPERLVVVWGNLDVAVSCLSGHPETEVVIQTTVPKETCHEGCEETPVRGLQPGPEAQAQDPDGPEGCGRDPNPQGPEGWGRDPHEDTSTRSSAP